MFKTIRFALTVTCTSFILMMVAGGAGISTANAHCAGKHTGNHPHCRGGEDPPPPPDPGGSADPQLVYRDGGMRLANADGSNSTLVLAENSIGSLDAPGQRILYRGFGLDLLTYNVVNGLIGVIDTTTLVTESQIAGSFQCCNIDWSQGGDKYMYSYWENTVDGAIYRIMVSPGGVTTAFGQHTIAWEGAPDGGLGSPAWDASGDYIYLFEEFNLGLPQILLVIDVRTATPTTPGTVVASADLTQLIDNTGFDPASNPQGLSASYQTGDTVSYSFDPGNAAVLPRSDTSLCLLIPLIDWSTRRNTRFTVIVDLPGIFDPDLGLNCSIATLGSPILNFEGSDFTMLDAGIVGQDTSKNRVRGVWVYDFSTGTRTKIIDNGGRPDWSN